MLKKTRLVALTSLGLFLGYCALQAIDDKNSMSADVTDRRPSNAISPANQADQDKQTHQADQDKQINMQKLSEAFGNFIGRNLQSPGLSFDLENIIKGIREGAEGRPSPLTEKEYEEMMTAAQERAFKEMSATNLKAANDFMEKNKREKGVTEVVPNKLQYTILKEGQGANVEPHSSPKINYTGKYLDGTVFGTSEEMGGPITIPLDQTIPGFSKGIIGMKEGEKRRLFVHPDLGYGTTGQLPPNELLIFDIDVVKANSDEGKNKDHHAAGTGAQQSDNLDDDDEFFLEEEEEDVEPMGSNKGRNPASPAGSTIKTPQPQTQYR
jgi:peptidylprolyl isomerase